MNTGIQDAHNLAWKLALVNSGHSPESLLDSYHAEREPLAQEVLRTTDRFTRIATLSNPLAQRARNLLLSWVAGIESIEHRIVEDLAELNIDYRRSPIVSSAEGERLDGPAAGARAPDAELKISESVNPLRLYELLRDPRHMLLLFPGSRPSPDDRRVVEEVADAVTRKHSDRIAVQVVSSGPDIERRYAPNDFRQPLQSTLDQPRTGKTGCV